MMQVTLPTPRLHVEHISKSYSSIPALTQVSLQIAAGEIHALCGENGAGKSTLIRILSGVTSPDAGAVFVDGSPLRFGKVNAAEASGIAVIHQEPTVFPDLDAVDNLFVGRELTRWRGWYLDRRLMRAKARDLLATLDETVPLDRPVGQLSLAQRQMVAMSRALMRDCRILILDEPTASLSSRETQVVLRSVQQLSAQGVSVLYVSHRLEEVFEIADRVTVLRDGACVACESTKQLSRAQLIAAMVGREVNPATKSPAGPQRIDRPRLELQQLSRRGSFTDISFTVRSGEIVGLGGLVGAGRSELARAIVGIDPYDSGTILVDGNRLPRHSLSASISAGVAMVPEDRQREGLITPLAVGANLSLARLMHLQSWGRIDRRAERRVIAEQMKSLQVKAASPLVTAATLSGGNQQKLVLGKWLACRPGVFILDEPTRGVDIGAKDQFHRLIRELSAQGLATLLISSDLAELLALSHRIIVLREGRQAGELLADEATAQRVLELALPDGLTSREGKH